MELLKFRARAKLTRIAGAFKNPRRQLISAIAIFLGFVWLSQAIGSMLFRQPADRADLLRWIPIGLLVYTLWHLIKIVSRKPVEPFEWTPAEDEYVRAAPITRPQLISYRLASILSASVLKALCFSIVMIPDLNFWITGLIGMFLGLVFVDLSRVCFELIFCGLSKRGQIATRTMVLAIVFGTVAWTLFGCMTSETSAEEIASPGALLFFKSFVGSLIGLAATPIGEVFTLPYQAFSELILTEKFSLRTIGFAGAAFALVAGLAGAVYALDRWMLHRQRTKERLAYQQSVKNQNSSSHKTSSAKQKVRVPIRLNGFGSIVWRQLLGAYHYRMTLAISLGVPTFLCCIPLFAKHNPTLMLINVVGGIVFYSFLLLPSALMLDFRRDIHRMAVLKSLPISPLTMTLGQLAGPVILCSLFQWLVLTIACCLSSIVVWQAVLAGFLLVPLNLLIFSIENYIFMLSPYRHNQEGIDVFLRTILTFTAKGILFAIGLALVVGWALGSRWLGAAIAPDSQMVGPSIFGAGIWLMTCLVATGFIFGLTRIYHRFDPSQDLPAND